MSYFSHVDGSPDPASLVALLDTTAAGLAAMKSYIVTAACRAIGSGVVIDIGSGAGHDLERLTGAGFRAVGIEPSTVMLETARSRRPGAALLVRADGGALPLRDGSVDGCRIERVLQHVDDPRSVLAEAARVLRPGGFLAAFEPDWTAFRFDTDVEGARTIGAILHAPRHPDVGRRLVGLIEECGCEVLDEVTEASRGETLASVRFPVERNLRRAVDEQRVSLEVADEWWSEQCAREAAGTFRAYWTKILVIARRRPASG